MKLSIITVNKNNAIGLERTCQSVICQTFEDFEWIIIDGASSDNSVDIIKNYENKMTYWVSEPDTGVYNAMNKGIRQAKGEYCLFLNSGDWLISLNSLKKAFDIIKNLDYADFYYGDCLRSDNFLWEMPHDISIDCFYLNTALSHQNTFIKRSLFFDHEFYNESYLTISDAVFFVKEFWLHNSKFIYINTIISVYDYTGISTTYKFVQQEYHAEIKKTIGDSEFDILVMRYKPHETQETQKQQKHKRDFIKKIIKYLLPYGMVRFFQKYILK